MLGLLLVHSAMAAAADTAPSLPDLGPVAGELAPEQAWRLGRAWLRLFRRQADTDDDPLLQDYLHHLSHRLATHSTLKDRRLDLVVVNNPQLNAFAVPGGVIGIHNGLLDYARNEAELAAVLAHEIGHLDREHFARSQEQARRRALPTMLGVLTGVLAAIAGDVDAAFALLYSSQAANIASQLHYSRQHELEADRVSVIILQASGIDPEAVATIFERLNRDYRFRDRPPPFLLTHPITEERVARGRAMAQRLKQQKTVAGKPWIDSGHFALMQARVRVRLATDPKVLITRTELAMREQASDANRYGYALALLHGGNPQRATEVLQPLLDSNRVPIPYYYAAAEIALEGGQAATALPLLETAWQLYPGNYPLGRIYAHVLNVSGNAVKARRILRMLLRERSQLPSLWLLLAESQGMVGNIVGVHEANAEQLILTGRLQEAQRRLQYALRLVGRDAIAAARISNRIASIVVLRREERELLR